MLLTLGAAAKLTGQHRTTILRAVRNGRLSATRRDDGAHLIDPAELERVFTIKRMPDAADTPKADVDAQRCTQVSASPAARQSAHPENQPSLDAHTASHIASLEAEVRGLQALLAEVRSSRDEARARDHEQIRQLQEQNRMLLAALPPPRRSWRWTWWRS
jgi:hypothetical protein